MRRPNTSQQVITKRGWTMSKTILTVAALLVAVCVSSTAQCCDDGYAIEAVLDDGNVIKLDDGSLWKVDPASVPAENRFTERELIRITS
jgi:hypothetical protein